MIDKILMLALDAAAQAGGFALGKKGGGSH